MKKDIVKDPFFLSQKAIPANPITDKSLLTYKIHYVPIVTVVSA